MLTLTEHTIPTQLRIIPNPPKTLYVLGDTLNDMFARPRVAIVGTRKVTPYGRGINQQPVGDLAARDNA